MPSIKVTRTATLPDPLRINRYKKAPELGPNLLFFSGGTALNEFSKVLKNYTHNSIHLVTPFDSGGSSAALRKFFSMPSIGDLRSRLMALADETVLGHPEVYALFHKRLSMTASDTQLETELIQLSLGDAPEVAAICNPIHQIICDLLSHFVSEKPSDFPLQGASIGNLILAGGYLTNQRQLSPTIYLFSQLVGVQGTVKLVTNADLELGAELENGDIILGQHQLTGKEAPPISSPISRIFLSQSQSSSEPVSTAISESREKLIKSADVICYPPGSYYSSLMANLLPVGVCSSIAENGCPKVYIPNLNQDPEQIGLSTDDCLRTLVNQLQGGCHQPTPVDQLLNFVLIDSRSEKSPSPVTADLLKKTGVQLIDTPLFSQTNSQYYDNKLLAEALLSLA